MVFILRPFLTLNIFCPEGLGTEQRDLRAPPQPCTPRGGGRPLPTRQRLPLARPVALPLSARVPGAPPSLWPWLTLQLVVPPAQPGSLFLPVTAAPAPAAPLTSAWPPPGRCGGTLASGASVAVTLPLRCLDLGAPSGVRGAPLGASESGRAWPAGCGHERGWPQGLCTCLPPPPGDSPGVRMAAASAAGVGRQGRRRGPGRVPRSWTGSTGKETRSGLRARVPCPRAGGTPPRGQFYLCLCWELSTVGTGSGRGAGAALVGKPLGHLCPARCPGNGHAGGQQPHRRVP